jgi:hypothetical protein
MVGDTGITLHISLTDGGVPYVISDGCLAKLSIKRPTGTYIEEFCTIRNNAVIEYSFRQNENTCAVEGIHHCDVTLYSPNGERVGGPRFTMVVSEKVVRSDDIFLSNDDYTVLNAMVAKEAERQLAENARADAETNRANAESERVEAESARVEAEELRAEAENLRVEADRERQERLDVFSAGLADQQEQINDCKDQIAVCRNDLGEQIEACQSEVREQVGVCQNELRDHNRRIETLESGVIAGFETDSTVAYQKTVPAKALAYAELEKSGVASVRVPKSTNLFSVNDYELHAPYEVGVKKAIGTVELPAGRYYISYSGSWSGYYMDESSGKIVVNDFDGRWFSLDNAETVTVYAVMYNDYSSNGIDFEWFSFDQIGIFTVVADGDWEHKSWGGWYEPYCEAHIDTCPLTAIKIEDVNGENAVTLSIPSELVELQKSLVSGEGGVVCDYIDWVNKKLYKRMVAVDLGDLSWSKFGTLGFKATLSNLSTLRDFICVEYPYAGSVAKPDEGAYGVIGTTIIVNDSRYADVASFKAAVTGTTLYYAAATPEIIDIDTGDFDNFIKVYPGGKITFVNAKNADIPSAITYQMKEV